MTDDVVPDEIVVDPESRLLEVGWSDGRRSRYGFDLLRSVCPCATCNDRRAKAGVASRSGAGAAAEGAGGRGGPLHVLGANAARPGAIDIVSVTPVGRYAINLRFSDGHAYGIFTFDFLRELDPGT